MNFYLNFFFGGFQVQKSLHKKTMIPLSLMILFWTFFPLSLAFFLCHVLLGQNLGPSSANLLYMLAHTNQFWLVASEFEVDSHAQSIMSGTQQHTLIIQLGWTSQVESSQVKASIHPSIRIGWIDWCCCSSVHPPPSRKHTLFVCLFVSISTFYLCRERSMCLKEGSTLFFFFLNLFILINFK